MRTIYGCAKIMSSNKYSHFTFKKGNLNLNYCCDLSESEKNLLFDISVEIKGNYDIITGYDFEKGNYVVFVVKKFSNNILTFYNVICYIILKNKTDALNTCGMEFSFNELDCFFPAHKFINYNAYALSRNKVKIEVDANKYDENFKFLYDNKEIKCKLGIKPKVKINSSNPLILKSYLLCQFEMTDDIDFLLSVFWVWYKLFVFLFYRQNINFGQVGLLDKNNGYIGKLYFLRNYKLKHEKKSKNDGIVNYHRLKENFSDLIQLFSDKNIYVEHFPIDRRSSHHVGIGDFILNMSAFEYTYKKSESLKVRLINALNENSDVLMPFIEYMYKINNLTVDENTIPNIANDLKTQRNIHAHGDKNGKFSDNFIINYVILKILNHCMVFKEAGYDSTTIKTILENTFNLRIGKQ